jgi:hypothetical protein
VRLSARQLTDMADHGLGRPVTIHRVTPGAIHLGHHTHPHSIDTPTQPLTAPDHLDHIRLGDTAPIEPVQ